MSLQNQRYYCNEFAALQFPMFDPLTTTDWEYKDVLDEHGFLLDAEQLLLQANIISRLDVWRNFVDLKHLKLRVCTDPSESFGDVCHWVQKDSEITLAYWGCTWSAVTHEMAHILHEHVFPDDEEHHGENFVICMCTLLRELGQIEAATKLKNWLLGDADIPELTGFRLNNPCERTKILLSDHATQPITVHANYKLPT